ncbi:hypothetical protein BGW38_005874 [Lunasporangiospora selenospora]|uniref:Uncharacterized protein n=1 Tax=Lunasporangiospora selenospora TaxID=979761 RepID=A0A9P6KH01_9FUNG|nr:hypothetical protein BGW38_005874 [Lunasporangiospora selenospora]
MYWVQCESESEVQAFANTFRLNEFEFGRKSYLEYSQGLLRDIQASLEQRALKRSQEIPQDSCQADIPTIVRQLEREFKNVYDYLEEYRFFTKCGVDVCICLKTTEGTAGKEARFIAFKDAVDVVDVVDATDPGLPKNPGAMQ